MKSALRDDGPVVFVDHKRLFPTAGEVPAEPRPSSRSARRRSAAPGRDVTIDHPLATWSASRWRRPSGLAREGVSCEVIDLRSLAPLDVATVGASVARTGALVTLEEGQLTCGVGAEVAVPRAGAQSARCASRGSARSPRRCRRIRCWKRPVMPDAARVVAAVRRVLDA